MRKKIVIKIKIEKKTKTAVKSEDRRLRMRRIYFF